MAKQTMEAIRRAEMNAEQLVKAARQGADAKIASAKEQAEAMISEAREAAAGKLAKARTTALADSRQAAVKAEENATGEIEALRRSSQKNEAKAIASVIAAMR